MKTNKKITDAEYAELKRELLKKLFTLSQEGKLRHYLTFTALRMTRNGRIGNVIHAEDVFKYIAYLREKAAVALPDGTELGIPRAEIERIHGPQNWNRTK